MALIRRFRLATRERYAVHRQVECTVVTFVANGRTYFQLDTHGLDSRKLTGKTSQSLQLDAAGATQLIQLLQKAFGMERRLPSRGSQD
jgi:hypothetical protein